MTPDLYSAVTYLDNAATTALRPGALEAMLPLLSDAYGNPSGAHLMARAANRALDDARETMADVLGAQPGEVIFTGGGTEADNLAIRGALEAANTSVAVCSAVEHHAVLDPVVHANGRVVGVDSLGRIDLEALATVLDESVAVVSVMLANNETGVIQPLDEVIELVRSHAPNALVHTDAVQALCWLDIAETVRKVDLVSISAHKFGGPKGVGVLVARGGAALDPLLKGGGQERGRRGGTHNVAGIAAMAVAAAETVAERSAQVPRVEALRDRLADGLTASVEGTKETGVIDGERSSKTANICHLCFEGVESEALLFLLEKEGIMASAASSCSSGAMEPSHVLDAMGYGRDLSFGSLRLSLGYGTTEADIATCLAAIPPAVARIRERS